MNFTFGSLFRNSPQLQVNRHFNQIREFKLQTNR